MCRNDLKLSNHDKAEIVLIFSMYRTHPLLSDFNMGNAVLTITANKARSLGVVFDDNMLFDAHVSTFADHRCTSSGSCQRWVLKYLTQVSSKIAVHTFITSKMDYCDFLLCGCRKVQLQKLLIICLEHCPQNRYSDSKTWTHGQRPASMMAAFFLAPLELIRFFLFFLFFDILFYQKT